MKTISKTQSRHSAPLSLSGKPLNIRTIRKNEIKRFNELLGEFHYMGEGRSGGDTMRFAIECDGRWVALFLWGSAAYCLKDRDEYISWSPVQRAQRQKLVVQNRRFAILAEPGAYPNLASRALALMTRELPGLWYCLLYTSPSPRD